MERYSVKLDSSFYERDTPEVARALLGCLLVSRIGRKNSLVSGIIVETEAYLGETDPGSHAFRGRTPRTDPMYGEPGRAYVYLIYGKYCLLNVVTRPVGTAGAVLIRALEPVEGIEIMKERRACQDLRDLTTGPGKLTLALGITLDHNTVDLTQDLLWVEPRTAGEIQVSSRIGVSDHQALRYFLKENRFVSRRH
ncbi:MAG: DNA-3-methyladenine glycosylase [Theionarchaea archaeon]|nr:DNA-3-methyladenine glycosylase [Theionarchaea archaeon]MBU7038993.1 DNA-3-methyladenine glycosylase [Theionarchaea archaeon]